jgi:hypothetical protein
MIAISGRVARGRERPTIASRSAAGDGRRAKIVKMERKQRAIEMVAQRRHESRQRHEYIERQLVQLRAAQGCQRLCLIARDTSLPLETIPRSLIVECFDAARVLANETREALLRRIDRRQRRVWKSLRRYWSNSPALSLRHIECQEQTCLSCIGLERLAFSRKLET